MGKVVDAVMRENGYGCGVEREVVRGGSQIAKSVKNEQYKAKLEEKYEVGENMKTATTRALKRRDDLLRDNLHNSPERKALLREGLKRRDVRMWKIIVGDPRQNHCGWRSLSAATLEGISEILGTQD
uniref:Uncharacterized protein n=1 Tax=Vitis vinifera TaxID=29760 RepID=F6HT66_VITVI